MKCLITGAAGFIGSHLCDRLLAEGHEVIGVDNLITGKKENIAHLASNTTFSFIEHDVSQPLPSNIQADYIFHFASPASPPKYQQFPVETLLVNGYATIQLLQKAHEWKAQFLFASTSEIYGDPEEHPQKETYWGNVNSFGPRSCYDEAKRYGEAAVYSYIQLHNLDARVVRIFNTYGPRMDLDDGRVVTNFIKQVIEEKPLALYGGGKQTRSFCYVSDLIEGIVKVALDSKGKQEVFNLGNPNEMTIEELAEKIMKLTGVQAGTESKPLPQDDPVRRKPDISKIKKTLGWEPEVSLEEGLKKTIAFFQAQQ